MLRNPLQIQRHSLWATVLACLTCCLLLLSHAAAEVAEKRQIMMPMRDGIELATNIYLPAGDGPWPIVLTRTPYNKDGSDSSAALYTSRGYVLVAQDVRGRYASQGENRPFEDDINDGYDTVEWLAAQPFSNGRIGIFGTSAPGITANLAAAAAPPHLTAAWVAVAPDSLFSRSRFINGVFKESHSGGWLRGQGVSEQDIAAYRARAVLDQRWRDTDFIFHRDNVRIPIYNTGGWHDIYAAGTVDNYLFLQYHGAEGARGNQKLFMGAFGHGALQGDLEYPNPGLISGDFDEQMRWWDYWLKDIDNGIMDEPLIQYYMMASARKGAASPQNRIVTTDSWPPAHEATHFYLQPDFGLTQQAPEAALASISYRFDPENPVPTVGGQNLGADVGPRDQREIGQRQDYLRFESAVLEEDLVIAGNVNMELYVSTDVPDTDFVVKLVDIYPDGYEALILDYPIRTRFRHGVEAEDLAMMTPGKVEKLVIDMWATAQTFEAGHRIGVQISSSNYPRFAVNPNNGAALDDTQSAPRVASNRIHLDRDHPSAIVLPVVNTALESSSNDNDIPRLASGRPDFQGIWSNATQTPLQRPAAFGERLVLSPEEAEAARTRALEAQQRSLGPGDPDRGAPQDRNTAAAYNTFWLDRGIEVARINGEFRSSLIVNPADGQIPYRADRPPSLMEAWRGDNPDEFAGPEQATIGERCLMFFDFRTSNSSAGPPMMPMIYNNLYRIVQTDDYLMILAEMINDVRIIRIDGSHQPPEIHRWMGDSVAHWHDDTLVITTRHLHPQQSHFGSTSGLVVTEELSMESAGQINYRFTMDDPDAYEQPWTAEMPFVARPDERIFEYACHEGNYALPGILAGARVLEAREAGSPE